MPTRKRTRFQVLYDESNLVGLGIRVCFIEGLQAAAEGLGFSLLRETEGAHSHVLLKVSGYWIFWFFSILRCGRSIAYVCSNCGQFRGWAYDGHCVCFGSPPGPDGAEL